MATIYSLLNKHTKNWWYHAKLRKEGNIQEARKRERQSIKDDIKTLRDCLKSPGGYASVGRGGWSVHYSNEWGKGTLQGYGGMNEAMIQCCLKLGIPVVNTRDCDLEVAYNACKLPLVAAVRQDRPYQ